MIIRYKFFEKCSHLICNFNKQINVESKVKFFTTKSMVKDFDACAHNSLISGLSMGNSAICQLHLVQHPFSRLRVINYDYIEGNELFKKCISLYSLLGAAHFHVDS